ncbi:hypothetical protein JN853_22360 [Pseudomonas syringae pv. actinidiae ICMP 9853]|nr:hypothetical protein JN853_22360 [Pseudomonas syringae pv. actinidiae ICMP 9853]PBK54321.1 hypothetical protein BUE60_10155 [Pseudomonas syringae pv. actinidiae]PBK54799.1 hypothetical protein BUE61_09075 [Pseudomonas syringae pv. actinidiae]
MARRSRLSFLTLQRRNAVRDAPRHRSAPAPLTQDRTRSVQSGMPTQSVARSLELSSAPKGGYPPLTPRLFLDTAENRHLIFRFPTTVTRITLAARSFDIILTSWHGYCYSEGRCLPCAARQNKSLQCRRVSAL